jgi:GT2 family glycosyltransferase
MIYICFPVFNRLALTTRCLESIFNSSYKNFIVVILDDGSTDNTASYIKNNYPEAIILNGDSTFYWAKGMNTCLKYVLINSRPDDYILMLNNDVEISHLLLSNLLKKSFQLQNECILGSLNLIINSNELIENNAFLCKRFLFFKTFRAKFQDYSDSNLLREELIKVDTLAAKGAFFSIGTLKKLGFIDDLHFRQYHGDTIYFYNANYLSIPIYVYKNAKLFSHIELTGFGTANKKNTIKEILLSFFSFKSGNYYKSIYYRSLKLNKNSILATVVTLFTIMFKSYNLTRCAIKKREHT